MCFPEVEGHESFVYVSRKQAIEESDGKKVTVKVEENTQDNTQDNT